MSSLQEVNLRVLGIRDPVSLQNLAAQITEQIAQGEQKPFQRVIDVSSGDPHRAGMPPLSFVRQVLAACLHPELLKESSFPSEVRQRAQKLLGACNGGSVGSYSTSSCGLPQIQKSVAEFITRRDGGVGSDPEDIIFSSGSQRTLMLVLHLLSSGQGPTQTGVLTPLPCPHTLPMLLDEVGVKSVPYRLLEEQGWALGLEELHQALKAARGHCKPRAIYISNPGNPTGHVQDIKTIEEVIRFAASERLVLLVEEVYQDSVFGEDTKFLSYKKVLSEMGPSYSESVEMVSFHSISAGTMGECGLRGGYMEVINIDPLVKNFLMCMQGPCSPPVLPQLALEIMVNPPSPGDASYVLYNQEILQKIETLSQNAQRACEFLNDLPGMSCQPAMGGVFLYPRLHLPAKMIQEAEEVNLRVLGIRDPVSLQNLAAQITEQIAQGEQKPFQRVIDVSSGDPHRAGMPPLSFVRQVLAACLHPELLKESSFPSEVRQRAQKLLGACNGGSVGSYSTSSCGLPQIQKSVAEFITRRDGGVGSDPEDIIFSSGSQRTLMLVLHLLSSGQGPTQTGVLTPLPCPHTLPMLLDEVGVKSVPYRLLEEQGWALGLEELHQALKAARGHCKPRAIYISNPGNPTGHVQDIKTIEEVIRFAASERLVLLVEEVYQDSVFGEDTKFLSYKKVLSEMGPSYSESVEMVSFHSISAGTMGECGLRGGYMEVINIDPLVKNFLMCMQGPCSPPVLPQLALEIMVNPPSPGDASYVLYNQEILQKIETLSQNAQRACEFLNDLPGMSCQPAMGGVFLYPRLHLPAKMIQEAEEVNLRVLGIRDPVSLQNLAAQITEQIAQGEQKPFQRVIDVSSGDPHRAGMPPLSFVRQVLAACLHPELLKESSFPSEVRQRAQKLLGACNGGSVGSYSTSSCGLPQIQKSVAEFITRRDGGVGSDPEDIIFSSGSQRTLMLVLHLLSSGQGPTQTGVLTPLPCPHTLPMLLDEVGVKSVPYRLLEEQGWALGLEELHQALKAARGHCKPRAIYISNPGNPTGHVQDIKTIEEVIRFAASERLVLLVEEVYQDSVFGEDTKFLSYKKVLSEMGPSYSESVEMVSFHSISAGTMGECGLRGGYMEVINIDPLVKNFLMCMQGPCSPPVLPQLALEIMVNPPSPGDASYVLYNQEILQKIETLSQNAQRACEFLNDLPGMSCQPAMGGVFLYPRLHLPAKMIQEAEISGLQADVLYCQKLLEEEGICLGPGSENGQYNKNYHIRLCVSAPPAVLEDILKRLRTFHLHIQDKHP